jgi:hypothetical protein
MELMGAFDSVPHALDSEQTRPCLVDPKVGHPGGKIAGDASTSTG